MIYYVWEELKNTVKGMSREDALQYCNDLFMDYDILDEYNNKENRDMVLALRAYIEDNIGYEEERK